MNILKLETKLTKIGPAIIQSGTIMELSSIDDERTLKRISNINFNFWSSLRARNIPVLVSARFIETTTHGQSCMRGKYCRLVICNTAFEKN